MVKFLNGSDLDDMQFIVLENERLLARVKQLESGSGGIMEMKQTIADKEKRIEQLENLLRDWSGFGCPYCSGDCGSANPPVISCIMQETRDLLMGKKND